MSKTEFLEELRRALSKLPSYEVEQSIAFYAEMIDDRMEDGMNEAEAVAALGPVGLIAAQITAEMPPHSQGHRKGKHRQSHHEYCIAGCILFHLGTYRTGARDIGVCRISVNLGGYRGPVGHGGHPAHLRTCGNF